MYFLPLLKKSYKIGTEVNNWSQVRARALIRRYDFSILWSWELSWDGLRFCWDGKTRKLSPSDRCQYEQVSNTPEHEPVFSRSRNCNTYISQNTPEKWCRYVWESTIGMLAIFPYYYLLIMNMLGQINQNSVYSWKQTKLATWSHLTLPDINFLNYNERVHNILYTILSAIKSFDSSLLKFMR